MEKSCKVCVTGGTGYIGSYLVKKLLDKGYIVHVTLRDLKNESKVGLLKSLPHSEGKLLLFEANIYNPVDFEPAIEGCQFVFHVATPLAHEAGSQYKDSTEASLAGIKSIIMACVRAGTVKRLIYTASVVSASPLKDDQSGFNDFMDETCWTPLNDSLAYLSLDDFHKDYVYSKTLAEKHILRYGKNENGEGLEVVTLPCGLVGGDTLQSFTPGSVGVLISQVTHNENAFKSLEFLENLLGKIPIVHVDDVCEAHIFCIENDSISGRYFCASSYISSKDIEDHYALHYPEFNVKQGNVDVLKKDIKWSSTKLCDKGFVYKYDTKMILDDSINCARRVGHI
ncbi:PREDICTED: anthocyanidin reductase ((2S)-flavan-3-ol-forming)-like [Lupinus angustifolius]|uniref:anthocyanidin reductase ((2S)-flavan-3-ol-forming)-like n=1 Tax=Lupinus angustifolius TaxID=3871 RepID=UPI00092F4032|nr:PREDICTED: anthocyanidin reductase ((2S)-flavan-3-ol-forming)-like [Lupinus angustifolius]XP_019419142.1 PREDICTED: anthocyanidin reductase ((2S)-flavan-3-ol-forming)-like [Lupinus angustifolius]